MMLLPCASSPAAAAITSITIKGGTSLRLEGTSRLLAFSSMAAFLPDLAARPAVAAFKLLVGGRFGGVIHGLFVIVAYVDPAHPRHLSSPLCAACCGGIYAAKLRFCLLYTSPSPRDRQKSR